MSRFKSWAEAREAVVATACPECWTTISPRYTLWHRFTEHGVALPEGVTPEMAKPQHHELYVDGELVSIGSVGDGYGD
jgi:hypothetical protein